MYTDFGMLRSSLLVGKALLTFAGVQEIAGSATFSLVGRTTADGLGGYGLQLFNCDEETRDGSVEVAGPQNYYECHNKTYRDCNGLNLDFGYDTSLWISGCGYDTPHVRSTCPEERNEDYISETPNTMSEADCNALLATLPTDLLLPGRGGDVSECTAVFVNWTDAICAKLPGMRERIAVRARDAANPNLPGSERFQPFDGFFCGPFCNGTEGMEEQGGPNSEDGWSCANGSPMYTGLDRIQHAILCAMGNTTVNCCLSPTVSPSNQPSVFPSTFPSALPTILATTLSPSQTPTVIPSLSPSVSPTTFTESGNTDASSNDSTSLDAEAVIIVSVVAGVVAVAMLVLVVWCCLFRKVAKKESTDAQRPRNSATFADQFPM